LDSRRRPRTWWADADLLDDAAADADAGDILDTDQHRAANHDPDTDRDAVRDATAAGHHRAVTDVNRDVHSDTFAISVTDAHIQRTLPLIQTIIFDTTCLNVGCHNSTDHAGGQSLASGESYGQLVGVTAVNQGAAQDGLLRVTAGNPDKSFLMTKLTLPLVFDPRYGSRMPLGTAVLGADQIEHLPAWILRGALPDETP